MTTLQLEQLDHQRHAIDAVMKAYVGTTCSTVDNSCFFEIQANTPISGPSPNRLGQLLTAL